MKRMVFENVRNKERFYWNKQEIQVIDGVEYMKVFRVGTQRECLVKKDLLKRIPDPN